MSDDVDILKELLRSVYLTSRQRDALRRVLALVSRGPRGPRAPGPVPKKATEAGTPKLSDVLPILGPGDEP